MKEILKDRRMAWAITVFLILASILTGTERSLNKLRKPIVEIFYNGVYSDGESIENDLQKKIEYAGNLITIAQRYLSDDVNLIFIIGSREELIAAVKLYEKYTANQKLTEAVNLLYNRIIEEDLSEKDLKYVEAIYANLKSLNVTISYDAALYNDKAVGFNSRLNKLPCSIVKSLKMVMPLELFEGVVN